MIFFCLFFSKLRKVTHANFSVFLGNFWRKTENNGSQGIFLEFSWREKMGRDLGDIFFFLFFSRKVTLCYAVCCR